MAAQIPGSLEVIARLPLDDKYIIQLITNVEQGLVFDGLQRFSIDSQKLLIRKLGQWKEIDTFSPLASNQVNSNVQGIVGLSLQDAILWLANHINGGSAPTPVILTSITINGPSSINEGSSSTYTVTGNYSDSTTQSITTGITWSSNAPNGVVTIASNSTVGDSTTITIMATVSGKSNNKTITINDTTPNPNPVTYNYTLPTSQGATTADGMSLAAPSTETLNFDLINGTSGPTISIAITSNGATTYIDYASEYAGKPYKFKNNQDAIFSGVFSSVDNLNITY